MALGRRTGCMFFSFETRSISSMQDIFSNAEDVTRHAAKAGKVVDIDQHQSFCRLQRIHAIQIKAEYSPDIACQAQHFRGRWDFTLDHRPMQYRAFDDGMHFLARDIEFDVITRILDVAHREIVGILFNPEPRHLLRCSHKMNTLHGTAIGGLDDHGVNIVWYIDQRARMADKVGGWNRKTTCLGIGNSYGLIAHQADGA